MANNSLVLDAQVFQGNDWNRGMGKYSLEFIRALMASPDYDYEETVLMFTKRRPLKAEVKHSIRQAAPRAKIVFLDLATPEDRLPWRALEQHNKQVLDQYVVPLVGNANFDFLVLALFTDYAYSVFPTVARKILVGYDLIPLLYSKHYRQLPMFDEYLEHYRTLFESDLILTISQTTADDIAKYLGIVGGRVFNIDGAPINRQHELPSRPVSVPEGKYILLPSGQEFRKNNEKAVEGFALYCDTYKDRDMKLVITSQFTKDLQRQLGALSGQVVFSGNVPEGEMEWLFRHAEGVLFATNYEGLGLPALEAIRANKPVVCSNISIFREISTDAFYFIDQMNPASIAKGIDKAARKVEWGIKNRHYPAILKAYSWEQTARKALSVLNQGVRGERVRSSRPRIAILCPNPEGYSDIGRAVSQLHPTLAEKFEIDYYTEDVSTLHLSRLLRPNYLGKITRTYPVSEFGPQRYKDYAAVIYHIGNSLYHLKTIKDALYLPGIAILHDTMLEEVFADAIRIDEGVSKVRLRAEELLNTTNHDDRTKNLTSLVNAQRAVVVHSTYAKDALENISEGVPIKQANLPTAIPKLLYQATDNKLHIGIAGNLHPAKGIHLIEALASMEELVDVCDFYLFGFLALKDSELLRLKMHPNIVLKADLTDLEFHAMLSKLNILVNYRTEYRGETSGTVTSAMRYGVIPIVRDIGWFSELPDSCAIKVTSEDEVGEAIKHAISHKDDLRAMSKSCYEYVSTYHTYGAYTDIITELIDAMLVAETDERQILTQKVVTLLKQGAPKERVVSLLRTP